MFYLFSEKNWKIQENGKGYRDRYPSLLYNM
jgi:hypothetical protein